MKDSHSIFDRNAWPLGVAFQVETSDEFFSIDWAEGILLALLGLAAIAALWSFDRAANAWIDYQLAAASYETSIDH